MLIKFNDETNKFDLINQNKEIVQSLTTEELKQQMNNLTVEVNTKLELMNIMYQALVTHPVLGLYHEH